MQGEADLRGELTLSFPSRAPVVPLVVPKLCLGMRHAKLCLANFNRRNESGIGRGVREAKQSFAWTHSQAELGNDTTTETTPGV